MLAGQVQSGQLPPVDERLPEDPLVLQVVEEIGQYGGTWHRLAVSPSDVRTPDRLMSDCLVHWDKDGTEIYSNVLSSFEASADGTEFTFRFRKGMKWSDGEPFGADDIMWYFVDQLGNEELNPAGYPGWLRPGDVPVKAEKIDEYTMKLSFASSAGILMVLLATHAGYPLTAPPRTMPSSFTPTTRTGQRWTRRPRTPALSSGTSCTATGLGPAPASIIPSCPSSTPGRSPCPRPNSRWCWSATPTTTR